MKTTYDAEVVLYNVLKVSALISVVTGKLERGTRSRTPQKGETGQEDVVINSLGISGDQVQRCNLNVNIYVTDLLVNVGGKPARVPAKDRLATLTTLAVAALKEGYGSDYNFWLVNQQEQPNPETGEHFVNLRVDLNFLFT